MADTETLEEIATYGNRRFLLLELAADTHALCGVDFVAREFGLAEADTAEKVEAFVADITGSDGESVREEYEESVDWDTLEEVYGDTADQYV